MRSTRLVISTPARAETRHQQDARGSAAAHDQSADAMAREVWRARSRFVMKHGGTGQPALDATCSAI